MFCIHWFLTEHVDNWEAIVSGFHKYFERTQRGAKVSLAHTGMTIVHYGIRIDMLCGNFVYTTTVSS